MNEKAAELGCQDSHFANPSGLNNEEHYVSAYDMALITRAAFENPTFAKIVETTYYKLPPNQKNPEGQGISPGNKLVKRTGRSTTVRTSSAAKPVIPPSPSTHWSMVPDRAIRH